MRPNDADPTVAAMQESTAGHGAVGGSLSPRWFAPWGLPFVAVLVLVAFVTRAIAAIAVHRVAIARGGDGFFFGDDRGYDQAAWQQAQSWHGIGPGVAAGDRWAINAYINTEAALYFVVGHHPLVMKLFNCLLGALVAGLVYLMARRLFGPLAGALAGVGAAFFPSTFLWSLTNLKETMFLFAAALLMWLLSVLVATGSWRLIVPLLAAFALVGGVRFYVQAMLGLLMPGAVLVQSRGGWRQRWALAAVLGVGCAGLLWFSGGAQFFGVRTEYVNQRRYCMAVGAESAYIPSDQATAAEQCWATDAQPAFAGQAESEGQPMVGQSVQELIAWAPTGMVYALAAPFPWAVERGIERVTIPEMVAWYASVGLAVLGLGRHWRAWRQYLHLLGYIGGILVLLALTQGNLGTLVRHRGMVIPFVLIFSGAGAAWVWSWWLARRPGVGAVRLGLDPVTSHPPNRT